MVEVGSIKIGGSIQTAEIERGLVRIEKGFQYVERSSKGVTADFDRMAARGKRLVTIFGGLAIAGTGALAAFAKGAPAVAGSMARIKVSMMNLKFAVGEAMKPTFEAAAKGLQKLANWVDSHPNLFRGIINSITGLAIATGVIKVGGWVYSAWSNFFGFMKGFVKWGGWASLGNIFKGIWTKLGNLATKIGGAISSILSWIGKLGSRIGGALTGGGLSSGVAGGLGVAGTAAGFMIGPLINTYQRELTGKPGFLDKQLQEYQNYQTFQYLKKLNRNQTELDMVYFV